MRRKNKLSGAFIATTMMGLFLLSSPASGQDNHPGLGLKECLTTALVRNPIYVESGLAIKSAEESVTSAQGRHWPRLSLDSAFIQRKDPFPYIQAQSTKIPPHFSDDYSSLGLTLIIPICLPTDEERPNCKYRKRIQQNPPASRIAEGVGSAGEGP
jgi:hypothetical protein